MQQPGQPPLVDPKTMGNWGKKFTLIAVSVGCCLLAMGVVTPSSSTRGESITPGPDWHESVPETPLVQTRHVVEVPDEKAAEAPEAQ